MTRTKIVFSLMEILAAGTLAGLCLGEGKVVIGSAWLFLCVAKSVNFGVDLGVRR